MLSASASPIPTVNSVSCASMDSGTKPMLFNRAEYLYKVSTLKAISEKQRELKVAIAYERMRKTEPVILDRTELQSKLLEYENLLEATRHEKKMKNIMCRNLQLADTMQKIVGGAQRISKNTTYTDDQKQYLMSLLMKKKELNRKLEAEQQKITKIGESILNLRQCKQLCERKNFTNQEGECDPIVNKSEELERLNCSIDKVTKRIQLLSRIIHSLILHSEKNWRSHTKFSKLMEECQKIRSEKFEELDSIDTLLKGVSSLHI